MKFTKNKDNPIFEDIEVPAILFDKYYKDLPPDCVKVYFYILYLAQVNEKMDLNLEDIAERLSLTRRVLSDSLSYLKDKGLLMKRTTGYEITPLKSAELLEAYTPKLECTVEETVEVIQNKKYDQVLNDINNQIFGGSMPAYWFTSIIQWIKNYDFTSEALLAMFKYNFRNSKKNVNYMATVFDAYNSEGIKTFKDFEKMLSERDKTKTLSSFIKRKLNLNNNLTNYQEQIVKGWINNYNYDKDVVNLAISISTNKTDVGINYYDAILKDWHKQGLKDAKEIKKYIKEEKENRKNIFVKNKEKGPELLQGTFEDLEELFE